MKGKSEIRFSTTKIYNFNMIIYKFFILHLSYSIIYKLKIFINLSKLIIGIFKNFSIFSHNSKLN